MTTERKSNPATAAEWAESCYKHKHQIQRYICDSCVDAHARQQVHEALEEAEKIAKEECHPECSTWHDIAALRGGAPAGQNP